MAISLYGHLDMFVLRASGHHSRRPHGTESISQSTFFWGPLLSKHWRGVHFALCVLAVQPRHSTHDGENPPLSDSKRSEREPPRTSLRYENVNDPSAGSPTETLLRLLLPLNDQVRSSSQLPRRTRRSTARRSEDLTKSFNR